MARAALDALQLDRVSFVPARQNPHKGNCPAATAAQRLAMLEIAIAGEPRFGVWTGELEREGPSYTVDTVEEVVRTHPGSLVLWLIGSDQLPGLARWYRIEYLVTRVGFVLVQRPGHPFVWPGVKGLNLYRVDNALHPACATTLREGVGSGKLPLSWLPLKVARYIRQHRLYQPPT